MLFFQIFKREKWRLVKTIKESRVYENKSGMIYFHLHESNKNNRKIEYASTFALDNSELEYGVKRSTTYQEILYRWLNGRHDPDIPRYDSVPEEDTFNALKGKVNS
jgi:hypothetical protein